MHFEITYYVGSHPFIYECTTAYEALDAMSDIFQREPIFKNSVDMDKIMETLLELKAGKKLSTSNHKYMIKYLPGEV
jgi:hypothetical protein